MVESTHKSSKFKNVVNTFTDEQKSWFDKLKSNLPEEQLRMAEQRIPAMQALKRVLLELIE